MSSCASITKPSFLAYNASLEHERGKIVKKGCLGCLYVFAKVAICVIAVVAVYVLLQTVREEGGRDLREAARAGDAERVSELLGFGRRWFVDVNRGALWAAVSEGHAEVAELLIEAGAQMSGGLLRSAATNGHADVVSLLIESGANPNSGSQPSKAENAVYNVLGFWLGGQKQWKEYLSPTYHPAALHAAIENGHTDVAAVLINAGANVLEPGPGLRFGNTGRTNSLNAVEKARFLEQEDMVELLEASVELPLPINVLNAAQAGDWERLSRLVALGVDVNAWVRGNHMRTPRWTALVFAARDGRADIVSTLLDNGAAEDSALSLALIEAARNGDEALVAMLLQAGAVDTTWGTARSAAGEHSHWNVVKMLKAAAGTEQ